MKECLKMSITIYDVAKKAGVSTATVSKIINNTGSISERTKKKVQAVMKELQYQPSLIATALNGKCTYTIGLLIPDLANPIFAEYARCIEDRAQELGFNIIMCSTDTDIEREAKYVSLLKQKCVDGFIIAAKFENVKLLKDLIKNDKIPVALIAAQDVSELPVDSVTVDDYLGGYQVTEYLLSLGHKRIGFIAEEARSSKERIRGYKQAIIEAGVEYDESLILVCKPKPTMGYAEVAAKKLLELPGRPTAIFGANDSLAIGAIWAARKHGLTIPKDLSVIGFDNTVMSQIMEPPLSTVQQPIQEIGRQVVDLLTQKIERKRKLTQRVVLLPELVIRQSTMKISK